MSRQRLAGVAAFLGGALAVLLLGWLLLELGPRDGGPVSARAGKREPPAATPPPRSPGLRTGSSGPSATFGFDRSDTLSPSFRKTPPRAGLLVDLDTGEVLWRRRPFAIRPVASLTKLMTALLVTGVTRPHDEVRITRDAINFNGSAVGLPRGKRVQVESLLAAMLVQSANDASLALAIESAGSVERFVHAMNDRARKLGLECTHFSSPHGLQPSNRSCAADLAVLARLAMDESRIRRLARRDGDVVPFPIKGGELHLAATNPLLRDGYPGAIGLKTGYTDAAGRCLVAVVRRGDRTLAAILIDSPDAGVQAAKLFDRAFAAGG